MCEENSTSMFCLRIVLLHEKEEECEETSTTDTPFVCSLAMCCNGGLEMADVDDVATFCCCRGDCAIQLDVSEGFRSPVCAELFVLSFGTLFLGARRGSREIVLSSFFWESFLRKHIKSFISAFPLA